MPLYLNGPFVTREQAAYHQGELRVLPQVLAFARRLERVEDHFEPVREGDTHDRRLRTTASRHRRLHGDAMLTQELKKAWCVHAVRAPALSTEAPRALGGY